MGLFSKVFGEKACGVCGKELGLLGKRKIDDGYICKDCAAKLSPFFTGRRGSTLEQINEQLAYREANKQSVAAFTPTKAMGGSTKIYFDEDARKFIVTGATRWREANPDVIDFSQVLSATYQWRETKTELKMTKPDGTKVSYNPPRYDIDYDAYVTIGVNSPWFEEIEFRVNENRIEVRNSAEYVATETAALDICNTLVAARIETRAAAAAAAAPKMAVQCPNCGATTIPDANGCCEYCGGPVGA